MDSITLAKSSVRGHRDGRLRSAATTKSLPLRFCPFCLEDSALSFLWFWRGRSLFSVATASSWLAYRSAMSKRSFTISGCRRDSFLSRSGSLTPFPKGSHDDCVADAQDGVLLLHEPLDILPEGFIFLLCDLVKIPLNPRFRERPLEVVDEFGAEISPGID